MSLHSSGQMVTVEESLDLRKRYHVEEVQRARVYSRSVVLRRIPRFMV